MSKSPNEPVNEKNIAIIKTFLENQKQDLANQAQDIELRKINEKNAHDYACKALYAQKEDRKEQRAKASEFMKYAFWLIVLVIVLLSVFVGVSLYMDKTEMLAEVFRVLLYILPTLFGGYFVGYNRGRHKAPVANDYIETIED